MNKKVVIFDFDGVLADSFPYFYSLISDSMAKVGLSLTPDQYRNFFIGNVHQSVRDFINDKGKLKAFLEFRNLNYDRHYYDEKGGVKLFPRTSQLVKSLSEKYVLTIASSGHQSNIENLMEKNSIKNSFALILANTATTKKGLLQEIMDRFQIKPHEAVMITDTVGDIKVAKEFGLKTVAVTWGFHPEKLLFSAKPDKVVKKIDRLPLVVSSLL